MIIEIKIPGPGESVTEVEIGRWLVADGSFVRKGEELAEIESDKATLTLIAEASGRISVKAKEGVSVAVGSVACTIDSGEVQGEEESLAAVIKPEAEVKPGDVGQIPDSMRKTGVMQEPAIKISPVAREMMKEHNLSAEEVMKEIRRIGKREIEAVIGQGRQSIVAEPEGRMAFSREADRERMTVLRRKLSERLVTVKNETAMLTTFNEVDMSGVMEIRKIYQQKFSEKHGAKLGFMSFFTKAVAIAAKFHPSVNSMIDGEEMVIPRYVDVGIAVQTPKGLMVPVVRNAESKSVADIEREIKDLAEKARNKKITMEELSGGTFTITNGGVFGSLLSTPIINPPQSAILGMHNIVERPVAVSGKVEIRPMMYIALSYDHRIIDGKDSVGFLVKVKEMIENPVKMVLSGVDPLDVLLEL